MIGHYWFEGTPYGGTFVGVFYVTMFMGFFLS